MDLIPDIIYHWEDVLHLFSFLRFQKKMVVRSLRRSRTTRYVAKNPVMEFFTCPRNDSRTHSFPITAEVNCATFLNIVVRQRPAVLQLFASKNKPLLIHIRGTRYLSITARLYLEPASSRDARSGRTETRSVVEGLPCPRSPWRM